VRVLDFSIMVAGPYCARVFADMGADLARIERPKATTSASVRRCAAA